MVHLAKNEPAPDDRKGKKSDEDLSERLSAFVAKLEEEADRRVKRRKPVEARWLEDLRQYHGVWDRKTSTLLKKEKDSSAFINLTRPKTDAMIARKWDLLFPTDDRNWGISPTPVPELAKEQEEAQTVLDDARDTQADAEAKLRAALDEGGEGEEAEAAIAKLGEQAAQAEGIADKMQKAFDDLHEELTVAKDKADLMQREIEDHLVECQYPVHARALIEDAYKIGTGILKGPVLSDKVKPRYRQSEKNKNVFELVQEPEGKPGAVRVDPWTFFPDPDCVKAEDSDLFFERHVMTKGEMRRMAKEQGINRDALLKVVKAGPSQSLKGSYLVDLQGLTQNGQTGSSQDKRFFVWEVTGAIEKEDMELLADAFEGKNKRAGELKKVLEEMDELDEINAKIWYCEGEVLRFALHPLDSGEPIYSVFAPIPDEGSCWGFGIPYIMAANQAILNGANRMMMKNAAISLGPQFLIYKKALRPQDGVWEIVANKIWTVDPAELNPGDRPFSTFDIDSRQSELANIMTMARQAIDEETSMPQIAQGEQGSGVTKTAQGMALLMNSANVTFRRGVKIFDDDITTPLIRRFYHWLMQFSDKEEIKGDYNVEARGSSVLLVREMQSQNLIMIADRFGEHPSFKHRINHDALLKHIFRALMIPAEEITFSDRQIRDRAEKAQQAPDPAVQMAAQELAIREKELAIKEREIEMSVEIANMEADTRRYVADRNFEATMHKVAEALNMKRDDIDAKMGTEEAKARSSERRMAVEAAIATKTGKHAGGSI